MSPVFTSLLVAAGLIFFAVTMLWRLRVLAAMKPEPGNRLDHGPERAEALVLFGPGLMHAIIFGAFMVLAVRTLMLFAMGFSSTALEVLSTPTDPFWVAHPTLEFVFNGYLFVKDLFALGALLGVSYFWYLRWKVK